MCHQFDNNANPLSAAINEDLVCSSHTMICATAFNHDNALGLYILYTCIAVAFFPQWDALWQKEGDPVNRCCVRLFQRANVLSKPSPIDKNNPNTTEKTLVV